MIYHVNKTRIVIVVHALLTLNILSQKDFREGYIISNNGDTLYGQIAYNVNYHDKCLFRQSESEDFQVYKPFDIAGYKFFNGRYFISKEVTIRNSYKKMGILFGETHLRHHYEGQIDSVKYEVEGHQSLQVFLEYLLNGELDLFFYADNNGFEHYFLENKEGEITDLVAEEIEVLNNWVKRGDFKSTSYQGSIKYMMKDYPDIFNQISVVSLAHRDMIKLTKKYHDGVCDDYNCVIYERNVIVKHEFGLYTGTNYGVYRNVNKPKLEYSDFFSDMTPLIGVYVKVKNYIPQKEKLGFRFALEYQQIKADLNMHEDEIESQDPSLIMEYTSKSISSSIDMMWSFSTSSYKIIPYVDIGVSGTYLIDPVYEYTQFHSIYADNYHNVLQIGLNAGLGCVIPVIRNQSFFLELDHEQSVKYFKSSILLGIEF